MFTKRKTRPEFLCLKRKKTLKLVADVCLKAPAFAEVDPDTLESMAERMSVHFYAPGDFLLKAGHEDDNVFVLLSGEAEVRTLEEEVINQINAGALAGEMRMVLDEPRSASVVAVSPIRAGVVRMRTLMRLMADTPSLREAVWKTAEQRKESDDSRKDGGKLPRQS